MFFHHRRTISRGLLISIGAGLNQIPLIREAKNVGYHVLGVDQNSSAPGLSICDLKVQESVINHEEIYNKIQEFLFDGKVRGVLTRSFGDAVRTTSFLNEYLGIPHIPSSRIDDLIDKTRMKAVLVKNGIKTPEYHIVNTPSQIKKFPAVIKPGIGHAKNGVSFVETAKEAEAYFAEQSTKGGILCERFINGNEIIVLGIAHRGKFGIFDITDKITTPLPYFVDIQHSAPSKYINRWNELEILGQKIIEAFGINTSPVVIEIRFDENNEPYVIEVVPEFGGEYLADMLLPERSGLNFMKQAIYAITGDNVQFPNPKKMNNAVVVKYITGRTGVIDSFRELKKNKNHSILYSSLFKGTGASVHAPVSNHDRLGVVITKGRDVPAAVLNADHVISQYTIRIKVKKEK